MTPEGRVKARINEILAPYGEEIYRFMPVPGGFGESSLDFICCFRGLFFAIEAKRDGGKPTGRQVTIIRRMCRAQGVVFVIDGEWGYHQLRDWLARVEVQYPAQPTTPISKCPISLSPPSIS